MGDTDDADSEIREICAIRVIRDSDNLFHRPLHNGDLRWR